jgi:MFS transporter, DHA3 family, macrolide efflux protein
MKSGSGLILSVSLVITYLPKILGAWISEKKIKQQYIKSALIYADLFIASSSMVFAILVFLKLDTYPIMLGIMALRAIGSGIQTPCEKVFLTELTPKKLLAKVNGYNTIIISICSLLCPAIGAAIVANISILAVFMLELCTATCAIIILLFIKIDTISLDENNLTLSGSFNTRIRTAFSWHILFTFFIIPITFLTPLLITRLYQNDVIKLAYNEIAYSLGAIIAGILAEKFSNWKNANINFILLSFLTGIFILTLSLVTGRFYLYLFIMFLAAFFITVFQIQMVTVLQMYSTTQNRTKVFSRFELLTNITLPMGMLVWGILGDYFTSQETLMYSGFGMLICCFIICISIRKSSISD